jgi:cyclic pyranopterin phosphate synthase
MSRVPSYLRVVVTARCSLACAYCHQEGDPATAMAGGLDTERLLALLDVALDQGIRKLKLLGGEPLLRRDLPAVIAHLRGRAPHLDLSLITGGAVDPARLDACFDAGLSRANLSVHGWSLEAFRARTARGAPQHAQRQRVLEALLRRGRFLKLNYVWRGPADDADLAGLLDHAAGLPVVVSVLDDLSDPGLSAAQVLAALTRLRGLAAASALEEDPHSLSTLRLRWSDGLEVEVKDQRLGAVAPWSPCGACPARARCREGIWALRLSHDGRLRPCMDRPDLGVDLLGALGRGAAAGTWASAVRDWTGASSTTREVA